MSCVLLPRGREQNASRSFLRAAYPAKSGNFTPGTAMTRPRRRGCFGRLSVARAMHGLAPPSRRRLPAREELCRILRHAFDQHFEVQVRSGRAARVADLGDALAAPDEITRLDEDLRRVRIARHEAVAVIELEHMAVRAVELGRQHDAASRRLDRRSASRPGSRGRCAAPAAGERVGRESRIPSRPSLRPADWSGSSSACRRPSNSRDSMQREQVVCWSVASSSALTTRLSCRA